MISLISIKNCKSIKNQISFYPFSTTLYPLCPDVCIALSSNSYNFATESSADTCTKYTVLPVNDLTFNRNSPVFPVASLI